MSSIDRKVPDTLDCSMLRSTESNQVSLSNIISCHPSKG